jgi:hypothetical protein
MMATFLEMCWTPSEDQERRVAGEMIGGSEKLSFVNLGKVAVQKRNGLAATVLSMDHLADEKKAHRTIRA